MSGDHSWPHPCVAFVAIPTPAQVALAAIETAKQIKACSPVLRGAPDPRPRSDSFMLGGADSFMLGGADSFMLGGARPRTSSMAGLDKETLLGIPGLGELDIDELYQALAEVIIRGRLGRAPHHAPHPDAPSPAS